MKKQTPALIKMTFLLIALSSCQDRFRIETGINETQAQKKEVTVSQEDITASQKNNQESNYNKLINALIQLLESTKNKDLSIEQKQKLDQITDRSKVLMDKLITEQNSNDAYSKKVIQIQNEVVNFLKSMGTKFKESEENKIKSGAIAEATEKNLRDLTAPEQNNGLTLNIFKDTIEQVKNMLNEFDSNVLDSGRIAEQTKKNMDDLINPPQGNGLTLDKASKLLTGFMMGLFSKGESSQEKEDQIQAKLAQALVDVAEALDKFNEAESETDRESITLEELTAQFLKEIQKTKVKENGLKFESSFDSTDYLDVNYSKKINTQE